MKLKKTDVQKLIISEMNKLNKRSLKEDVEVHLEKLKLKVPQEIADHPGVFYNTSDAKASKKNNEVYLFYSNRKFKPVLCKSVFSKISYFNGFVSINGKFALAFDMDAFK